MDPRQSITNVSNKLPKLDTAQKALLHQGGFSERADLVLLAYQHTMKMVIHGCQVKNQL